MYLKNIKTACSGPLAAMAKRQQFIVCRFEEQDDGRILKIPVNPRNGHNASATNPQTWLSANNAQVKAGQFAAEPHDDTINFGVGFVFTRDDPFFFLDVDHCRDASTGEINERGTELLNMFQGAAVEVSYSGTGLHVFGTGAPTEPHRTEADDNSFELYSYSRFAALTGDGLNFDDMQGDAGTDHTANIQTVLKRWFTKKHISTTHADWTDAPVLEWRDPGGVEEIISLAKASSSVKAKFGDGVSFADLFDEKTDVLSKFYPDDHGRGFDSSRADMALACHLMFFTGRNCELTKEIMKASALNRGKWEKREKNYLELTILNALRQHDPKNVYTGAVNTTPPAPSPPVPGVAPPPPPAPQDAITMTPRTGSVFLWPEQQPEYFKGCWYIYDLERVIDPRCRLLTEKGFDVQYGGRTFVLDKIEKKGKEKLITTTTPSKAFKSSPKNNCPTVDRVNFDPLSPTSEVTVSYTGVRSVNSYIDRRGRATPGDVTPFLDHIKKLLPDEWDQEVLLTYLAGCVQLIGKKFQWCVLLQGTEGNGKTVLYNCLEHAIGYEYCHQLDPKDIGNKFNAWLFRRLLVAIEEIAIKGKYEVADHLKPLITNKRVPYQPKNMDQTTADNCANFFLTSNHPDAILKTKSDRRYCVFYTAQQEACDLARDEMDSKYFEKLFDWLDDEDGYAHVAHYLRTRQLDPRVKLFGRTPKTTSTEQAIEESRTVAEVEVRDAIDSGRQGFVNGMVSAQGVKELLKENHRGFGPRSVKKVIDEIGYVVPPLIQGNGGRVIVNGYRHKIYVDSTDERLMAMGPDELAAAWHVYGETY